MNQNKNQEEDTESREFEEEAPSLDRLIGYLESEPGNALANRILDLIQEVKKSTIDNSAKEAGKNSDYLYEYHRRAQIFQAIGFLIVIIAASFLAFFDKFTPTIGLLLGTVLGYLFGRKIQEK